MENRNPGIAPGNDNQKPGRRPYESPSVRRQDCLKDITLFTNFGPEGNDDGSGENYSPHQQA